MIHLVLGKQGSGKTLFLVKEAYDKYRQGKIVYSNVHLKFPYRQLDYNDIINCKLENGIVIIDEIHLLLPSRNSMSKTSKEICDSFLSMVRKKKLEVYGTTQFERKVDVRFREEKDFLYLAEKYAMINNQWVKVLHNQDLNKKIPIMISLDIQEMFSGNIIRSSFIGNPFFNKYDSNQVIKVRGLKV